MNANVQSAEGQIRRGGRSDDAIDALICLDGYLPFRV